MKRCRRCGVDLPAQAFRSMASMRDGLDSWCIACHRQYSRDHARRRAVATAPARAAERASRDAERRRARELAAQVRAWERAARRVLYATCAACGRLFVARRIDAQYCSRTCTPNQARKAQNDRERRRMVTRVCAHCGATFAGGAGRKRFCSLECGVRFWRVDVNAKRRAMKRAAYVEHVYRRRVFERDAWQCYLCGYEVRRDVDRYHPLAPELDHVVPLARGGAHSYANVRTAHRRCNQSKGARLVEAA